MQLNIIVDDYSMDLNLPEDFVASSAAAFDRLESGMLDGVQMGRDWIERPNRRQCCQVAADKLLTALETDNENLAMLSAGFIVSRLPRVRRVRIDTSGEISGTSFE